MDAALLRLRGSYVIAVVGAIVGFLVGQQENSAAGGALVGGYIAWACYWGIPRVVIWWYQTLSGIAYFGPMGWIMLLFLLIYLPLVVGYLYGVLGGGFYEFWQCRRISKGWPAAGPSPEEPSLAMLMAIAEERRSSSSLMNNRD